MKRLTRLGLTAVASAMLAISGSALAVNADKTLTARVTVTGGCVFDKHSTSSTELNFGTVDATTVAVAPTATATVFYNCSKDLPYSVAVTGSNDSAGSFFLKDAGTRTLPYSRTVTGAGAGQTGAGMGVPQQKQVVINGSIAVTDVVSAAATSYTDSILVRITY